MNAMTKDLFGFTEPQAAPDISDALQTIERLATLPLPALVDTINRLRRALHEVSPFASEPVDFVEWVPAPAVTANEYNPNSVAPPEMAMKAAKKREAIA